MQYERSGEYSAPFTLVNNNVSRILNQDITQLKIVNIYRTFDGDYVVNCNGWRTAENGWYLGYKPEVVSTVGDWYYKHNGLYRIIERVYDPSRDRSFFRPLVKISTRMFEEVADKIFEELDRLERQLYLTRGI